MDETRGFFAVRLGTREVAAIIDDDGNAALDGKPCVPDAIILRRLRRIDFDEYRRLLLRSQIIPADISYPSILMAASKWTSITSIGDAAAAESCRDLLAVIRDRVKALEVSMAAAKAPHIAAAKKIDEEYRPTLAALSGAKVHLHGLISNWLIAERAKAAAKIAAQALLSHATAEIDGALVDMPAVLSTPPRPSIRGAVATRAVGLRAYKRAALVDYDLAVAHYRHHPDIVAALSKLASADARRGAPEIPGFTIIVEERATI